MKNLIVIIGFTLIIIGTTGTLLNEFVWQHSSISAIIFAVLNFTGLAGWAFTHFVLREY